MAGLFYEAKEFLQESVISGGDPPEFLEFSEEALDLVSLLVERFVIVMLITAVTSWGDSGFSAGVVNRVHQAIGVIDSVCHDIAGMETIDKFVPVSCRLPAPVRRASARAVPAHRSRHGVCSSIRLSNGPVLGMQGHPFKRRSRRMPVSPDDGGIDLQPFEAGFRS